MSLTQKRLKEYMTYCPDSGNFTSNYGIRGRRKGAICGARSHGYIVIRVDNVLYRAHRLAFLYMTGEMPSTDVDHINHDRSDNRWSNLRLVDRVGNMRNSRLSAANTSGFTGVSWAKSNKKWSAQITLRGKKICLGHFDCKQEAIKARKLANEKYGYHENHGRA